MRYLLLIVLFSLNVVAAEVNSSINIENLRALETPHGASTGVIYMDIINSGTADRLLGAQAEDVAATTELHTSHFEGNLVHMRKVDTIDIPSNETTSLKAAGAHLMLVNLKQSLKSGQNFILFLHFERAGTMQLSVPIQKHQNSSLQ
jgi:periplasmic copper chaperone A